MKKFFWIFVFILNFAFWSGNSAFATDVSGIVSTDTTWTVAESPYTVTGDVTVAFGAGLTIEPGVTVDLSGKTLRIDGVLNAEGTEFNHIVFTGGGMKFTSIYIRQQKLCWVEIK